MSDPEEAHSEIFETDSVDDNAGEQQPVVEENAGPELDLSSAECREIEALKAAILADPMANIEKLEELVKRLDINLLKDRDVEYFLLHKHLLATTTAIFLDIIPSYKIEERVKKQIGKEKSAKERVAAETKKLLENENRLMKAYKEHLGHIEKIFEIALDPEALEKLLEELSLARENFDQYAAAAGECVSILLSRHHEFDHRSDLIELCIKIMCSDRFSDEQKTAMFKSLENLFFNDVTAEAICELVTNLCKKIVFEEFRVVPDAINFLDHLPTLLVYNLHLPLSEPEPEPEPRPSKRKRTGENLEMAPSKEELNKKHKLEINERVDEFYKAFWSLLNENNQRENWVAWYQPLFVNMVRQIAVKCQHDSDEDFTRYWSLKFKQALNNESLNSKLRFGDRLNLFKRFLQNISCIDEISGIISYTQLSNCMKRFSIEIYSIPFTYDEFQCFLECAHLWISTELDHRPYSKKAVEFARMVVNDFLTIAHNLGVAETLALLALIKFNQRTLQQGWLKFELDNERENRENDENDVVRNRNITHLSDTRADREERKRLRPLISLLFERNLNGYVRYCIWLCFFKPPLRLMERPTLNYRLIEEYGISPSTCHRMCSLFQDPVVLYGYVVKNTNLFV